MRTGNTRMLGGEVDFLLVGFEVRFWLGEGGS